jgi:Spy/CpxP family protein refolding chaperone
MNSLTQSKIILYLAIIFVAGGITGTVIAWGSAKRKMADPPSMEKVCSSLQERLKTKLELTPDQLKKIQPILDQAAQEMQAIHGKTMEQIDQTVRRTHEEIAKELSPAQKKKLAELDSERCEFMQKRLNRGPSQLAPVPPAK